MPLIQGSGWDALRAGGAFVTDVSNAARTCLMDIRARAWDAGLLARFGLTETMLPRIRSNAEVYGHVQGGPLAGVPIAGEKALSVMSRANSSQQQPVHAAPAADDSIVESSEHRFLDRCA